MCLPRAVKVTCMWMYKHTTRAHTRLDAQNTTAMYPLVQWSSYDHITLLKKRSWLCPRPHPIPSHPIPIPSIPIHTIRQRQPPKKKTKKVEGGVNDPHLGPIDIRSRCKTCDEGGGGGGFAGKSEPKTATFKTKKLNGGWFGLIGWLVGWLVDWLVGWVGFFCFPFFIWYVFSRSVFFF